jgi:hypothetical protein
MSLLSHLRPSRDRDSLATAAANRWETGAQHRTATTGDRESLRGSNCPRSPARQFIWVSGWSGQIRHSDVMRSVPHTEAGEEGGNGRTRGSSVSARRMRSESSEWSAPEAVGVLSVVEEVNAVGDCAVSEWCRRSKASGAAGPRACLCARWPHKPRPASSMCSDTRRQGRELMWNASHASRIARKAFRRRSPTGNGACSMGASCRRGSGFGRQYPPGRRPTTCNPPYSNPRICRLPRQEPARRRRDRINSQSHPSAIT